jgi:hypothetical protein
MARLSSDRLAQYLEDLAAYWVESPESIARAREFQRRERAGVLEALLRDGDVELFDYHFLDYYDEDAAIVLVLSEAAAARGLALIQPANPNEVQ